MVSRYRLRLHKCAGGAADCPSCRTADESAAKPTTAATAASTIAPTTAPAAPQPTLAPTQASSASAGGADIIVGGSVPLSGDAAIAGVPFYNAAQMAVEEWNSKGGVLGKKITTHLEDDACDPKQAATVTPKILATPY